MADLLTIEDVYSTEIDGYPACQFSISSPHTPYSDEEEVFQRFGGGLALNYFSAWGNEITVHHKWTAYGSQGAPSSVTMAIIESSGDVPKIVPHLLALFKEGKVGVTQEICAYELTPQKLGDDESPSIPHTYANFNRELKQAITAQND